MQPPIVVLLIGLIPAHAGKTPCSASRSQLIRAHPRSRGENRVLTEVQLFGHGSSPLTRGKRPGQHAARAPDGLIPAHAGKTGRRTWTRAPRAAHPRSRGENHPLLQQEDGVRGSSPLTRGKPCVDLDGVTAVGLIPAHAGKTLLDLALSAPCTGSSPLTRGKRATVDREPVL